MGGGGPMGMIGMPVQKAKDFKGTARRLIGYLRPHRVQLGVVVIDRDPEHHVQHRRSPRSWARPRPSCSRAWWRSCKRVPGAKIDFDYIGQILLILAGLYVISALFSYLQQYVMAGVAQKTVFAMRRDVEAKLARLPLKFFDARTHGEILSRVTNDVDNIANTLQQSLTQFITSVVTMVGIMIMMLTISPPMTLIALSWPCRFDGGGDVIGRQALAEASSSPSRSRSASSTATSKRCIPATRSSKPSATRATRSPSSTRSTTGCTRRAGRRSSSPG